MAFQLYIVDAKEVDIFSGGRTSLRRVLKNIGFTYQKINNKKYVAGIMHGNVSLLTRAYYEHPKIVHQCHTYVSSYLSIGWVALYPRKKNKKRLIV